MDTKIIEKIFNNLQEGLPKEWKQVVFYAAYSNGSYVMKYFVKSSKGEYTDCFSLTTQNKSKLIKQFMNLDKVISPYREKLSSKEKWSMMTLTVDNTGKFKTDFDYSSIDDNMISFESGWKKKFLI